MSPFALQPVPAIAPMSAQMPLTLRLSVTERCNFRCLYCAPPGGFPKTPYRALPSLDQLANAVEWLARRWNVKRVKLTGGEPLLRPGITGLVNRLTAIEEITEVSLTTNGSALTRLARPLKKAGLKRVNISLDTLNSVRFREICGGDLSEVLEGIEGAIEAGLAPIKLNAVLRKSSWMEDVPELLAYAARRRLELRFIELMQIGPSQAWARSEFLSARDARRWVEDQTTVSELDHIPGMPSRQTRIIWGGQELVVGWITPESQSFCEGCDRLRLDSHGRLRRCLMDMAFIPLVQILENEGHEAALLATSDYMEGKRPPEFMSASHPMIAIGG